MKYTKEQIMKLGDEFKDLTSEQREEYVNKVKHLKEKGYSATSIAAMVGMSESAVRMILSEGI